MTTDTKAAPPRPLTNTERTPDQQRVRSSEAYIDAAMAAHRLSVVLFARAGAIREADHRRSLLLAHDMVDANKALQDSMFDAQDEHGKSLRADNATFLGLATDDRKGNAPEAPPNTEGSP